MPTDVKASCLSVLRNVRHRRASSTLALVSEEDTSTKRHRDWFALQTVETDSSQPKGTIEPTRACLRWPVRLNASWRKANRSIEWKLKMNLDGRVDRSIDDC